MPTHHQQQLGNRTEVPKQMMRSRRNRSRSRVQRDEYELGDITQRVSVLSRQIRLVVDLFFIFLSHTTRIRTVDLQVRPRSFPIQFPSLLGFGLGALSPIWRHSEPRHQGFGQHWRPRPRLRLQWHHLFWDFCSVSQMLVVVGGHRRWVVGLGGLFSFLFSRFS